MSGASFYRLTGRLASKQSIQCPTRQISKSIYHAPTSTVSNRQSLENRRASNPVDDLDANDGLTSRRGDTTSLDMQDRTLVQPVSVAAVEDDRGQSAAWLLQAKSFMHLASFSPASQSGGIFV